MIVIRYKVEGQNGKLRKKIHIYQNGSYNIAEEDYNRMSYDNAISELELEVCRE